ncbi:hypothetical protein LPY66_06835 [Dehalobacter sp. DCM]|uniref:hypothetical protein n=1 Tax=Dehalobacter sp. DCM TaxID=2907827 RepID=UPI003081CA99|nr:hypothetical protein LPY66_06835 [Dehalobacter sp. DCM]
MKPIVIPGILYLILYPVLFASISFFISLPDLYLLVLAGIYAVTVLVILTIWLTAKSKRIAITGNTIIFRSLFGKRVLEPKDIRKTAFFWTKKNEEIVLIKAGKKVYYLTDHYFPYNELLTDLEEYIANHHIRSNLAAHYGLKEA